MGGTRLQCPRWEISTDDGSPLVPPGGGDARTYAVSATGATFLRITAAGRDLQLARHLRARGLEVPRVTAPVSSTPARRPVPALAVSTTRDPTVPPA